MDEARRRRLVGPTGDWEQLELLCLWPEQRDYELIRPLVLFGSPAAERADETGAASERTLQRRARCLEAVRYRPHRSGGGPSTGTLLQPRRSRKSAEAVTTDSRPVS
jgi:hypothetical protein